MSFEIVPCCLQDYASSVTPIGQNHEVSGDPVIFNIDFETF